MKKLILAFAFFLPVFVSAQQQPRKILLYVQGGFISSLYLEEAVFNSIVSKTDTRNHNCPILSAGLQLSVSEKWRIGPGFSYDHFGLKDRSVEYSVLSYLLRCDRIWRETKKIVLYSGLSMGVRTLKHFENGTLKEHKINPGYHIYVVGAEIKIEKFLFDLNLGIGTSGILNAGLKYSF